MTRWIPTKKEKYGVGKWFKDPLRVFGFASGKLAVKSPSNSKL